MTIALASKMRFARALRSRSFALLWAGQTFSSIGNGAYSTALAWQVLLLTGSATSMSIVIISQTIPKLLFLLIGGVAADRFPRRLVMLWSDAGRATVVLLVAWLSWAHLLQLWHLIALSLFFGLVRSLFDPAYQAFPPELVEKEALSSANALNGLSQQINLLVGPLIGVGFVMLSGPVSAFAFDGLTFLVSVLCLSALRVPSMVATPSLPTQEVPKEKGNLLAISRWRSKTLTIIVDVREGFVYIASSSWLWISIFVAAIGNIGFMGPILVAMPKLVHDVYGTGIWLLGAMATASALGSIIAMLLIGQMQHLSHRGLIAYLAVILSSLALIGVGLPWPHFIASVAGICGIALTGFGLGIFEILWMTVMQELVPKAMLGRVSSVDMLGSFCLLPIGYAIAGVLTDHIGPSWVFISGGLLTLFVAGVALALPAIRQLE